MTSPLDYARAARGDGAAGGITVRLPVVGDGGDGTLLVGIGDGPVPIPAQPGTYTLNEPAWALVGPRGIPIRILSPVSNVPEGAETVTVLPTTVQDVEARALADRAITDLGEARTILEAADAALAGEISEAAKTALLEEIATAGGDLDPAVADALWTDFVIARFLVATDRIITKDVISDGAIIARHLAIAAEDALTGTTLTLTPDGLRIMASEGGDPLVALTTSGLLGLHLRGSSGAVSTSVTGTGIATPALSTGAISLAGEDLATALATRSRMVAYGYAASGDLADVDWSETRLLHIGFQAEAHRVYRLACSAITLAAKGTPAESQQFRTHMRVRHTLDGSEPTVSSPILWEALNGSQGIRRMTMTPDGLLMRFGADTTVRLIVTAAASEYGQIVLGGPTHFAIYDEGPMPPASGGPISAGRVSNGTNPGTPPAPPKTEYRKLYSPTWTRSYTGNGAHYQWPKDRGFLVQGTMPGYSNGITKSQWGYGTGPAADLAGVPLADILSVRVWLDVSWTYASSGGAIRLNHHGQLADPGVGPYPGLGVHIGDHAVTRRYSGWAEITGTKNLWQSGAIGSLQADPRGDASLSWYTNFNPGHLEIVYRK